MWNPDTYMKFSDMRTRPALELASRCQPVGAPGNDRVIYDLGCGPGNSTQVLASLFPDARITGVDSSKEMLDRAAKEGPAGVNWQEGDLNDWTAPEPAVLIFSNSAYNWLPGHDRLFPRLIEHLNDGGELAIQMPQNFSEPSHALMRETVAKGPFKERLSGILRHGIVRSPQE